MKIRVFATAGLLVCLGAAVPAARAQEKCSLQTIAGTYAFEERGSVTIYSLQTSVSNPYYTAWVVAPFANVGEVTMKLDGDGTASGTGYYWIQKGPEGAANASPQQYAVDITDVTIEGNCTGTVHYTLEDGTNIVERFVVFDQGREIRTVLASTDGASANPFLAWSGTFHRIAKSGEPAVCGPQTVMGTWLTTGEDIVAVPSNASLPPSPGLYDATLGRFNCTMAGECSGETYEKLGPLLEKPLTGTMSVNSDCSYEGTLNFTGDSNTYVVRGVLFDEGSEFTSLVFGPAGKALKFSPLRGIRIGR